MKNTGTGPLTLDYVNLGVLPPPGFSYSQVVCNGVTEPLPLPSPFTISPTQSCTFTVQFDPATTGSFSGGLAFYDNAAAGQSNLTSATINSTTFGQAVSLSGTGITAPPPSDFTISASSPVTVTAGNSGKSTVTISSVNGFTDTVNLSATVSPGVTASFNPNAVSGGSGTSTLTLATTAATPTGTSTITVTGTDTNGSPSHSTTLSLTVSAASGGGGGGGATCTCNKTGFVAPNQGASSKNDPLNSPHSKYTVTNTGTSTNPVLTVTRVADNKNILFDQSFPGAAWGFSPDDDRLLIDSLSGSQESVSVYDLTTNPVYNLPRNPGQPIGQTPLTGSALALNDSNTPSRIAWSPSGVYLLVAALTGPTHVDLYIYNVLTGNSIYSPFDFTPPPSGDKFGMAAWGFSPGTPEVSFMYAYINSSGSASLNVVNLDSGVIVQSRSVGVNNLAIHRLRRCNSNYELDSGHGALLHT